MHTKTAVLIIAAVALIAVGPVSLGESDGLAAKWNFDEGAGDVARDVNGNHARIHGAKHAKVGKGYALRFDGKDDYVDCGKPPCLNIEKAGTVALWFKPEAPQGGIFSRSSGGNWQDERLVLAFNTWEGAREFPLVLADGKAYRMVELSVPPLNAWSHMAVTIEGQYVMVFYNGMCVRSFYFRFEPEFADYPLLLGKAEGLGKPFFRGLMDDVCIYNRALSSKEIAALCKAQAEARREDPSDALIPRIVVTPHPLSGRLVVMIDYLLMPKLPPRATFKVSVSSPERRRAVCEDSIAAPEQRTQVEAILDVQDEPPGRLLVRVQPCGADGSPFGQAAEASVPWPERDLRFSAKNGVRVLNNLVFELLNVESPGPLQFAFRNPRDGWILITCRCPAVGEATPTGMVDGEQFSLRRVGGRLETMRHLAEGRHAIKLGKGFSPDSLVVRSVPGLFYSMYGVNPLVPETGDYTWPWLRAHVLDHYNCIIGHYRPKPFEKELKQWVSEGRQWYSQYGLPRVDTSEAAYEFWAKLPGMKHPLMHGVWADEFLRGPKRDKMYPIWCDGLRKLRADPELAVKEFYAYTYIKTDAIHPLLAKTVMDCGYRFALEWYLSEERTEEAAIAQMDPTGQRAAADRFNAAYPGAAMQRVIVLALLSQPEETCDVYADVDYNVFLDIQLHQLATNPAFFGIRGIQGYYSPYVGEEQTRLFARLLRHYAIEGRTERMLKTRYILTHLKNPDFVEGAEGWTLSPAAEGGIKPRTAEGFGRVQGRRGSYWGPIGDHVLWTRRDAARPNVISQAIQHLEPGQLYSLRFFTGNYQDLLGGISRNYGHGISVKIEGVEIIPGKCFQAKIKSCYAVRFKSFNRKNPYRMNYHQRVFRAKSESARLVLGDWASDADPGGPAGEELVWNFMQVQPYIADEP